MGHKPRCSLCRSPKSPPPRPPIAASIPASRSTIPPASAIPSAAMKSSNARTCPKAACVSKATSRTTRSPSSKSPFPTSLASPPFSFPAKSSSSKSFPSSASIAAASNTSRPPSPATPSSPRERRFPTGSVSCLFLCSGGFIPPSSLRPLCSFLRVLCVKSFSFFLFTSLSHCFSLPRPPANTVGKAPRPACRAIPRSPAKSTP